MSIASLVITPAIPTELLREICRKRAFEIGDVVSGYYPLHDMALAISADADTGGIGALLLDAVNMCVTAHDPERVHFVITFERIASLADDFEVVRHWLKRACGFNGTLSYSVESNAIPRFNTLRLGCVDWRVTPAIDGIAPAQTAWMRLPSIEGLLADTATWQTVLNEVRRIMAHRGTCDAKIATDPHEDCLARQTRNRRRDENDNQWRVRDLEIMRAEHQAAHTALLRSGIPCLNRDVNPVRCFRLDQTGEFALETW